MKYLVLCIILLGSFTLYAGTIDPGISDTKYVEYGKKFHSVCRIIGKYDSKTEFSASAVAISDHIILTAAHVVENSKECFVLINDKKITISKIIINKDFSSDTVGIGDLALLFCDESIGLDFYPKLYQEPEYIGKVCSISGYGMTGTFLTGANKSDGIKRAGSNVISGTYKDTIVCSPSRPSEEDRTSLEFIIASGDSGGGLFINGELAGISSFVSAVDHSPNSSYSDDAHFTCIGKYIDWIEENKE